MKRIAVTGGIASGKSTFARMLGDLGGVVIDYDQISRNLLAPKSAALALVRQEFGAKIINSDGSLDRATLAAHIFHDSAARAKLNKILHPLIEVEARRQEAEAVKADPNAVIIHDIPLFVGSWLVGNVTSSVLISVPIAKRLKRMINIRQMSEIDANARIEAQLSDCEIAKYVDSVVDNCGSLAELQQEAEKYWQRVLQAHDFLIAEND